MILPEFIFRFYKKEYAYFIELITSYLSEDLESGLPVIWTSYNPYNYNYIRR